MTCAEENAHQNAFKTMVEKLRPDIVLAKGRGLLERDNYRWLKDRNIPVVIYVANANHNSVEAFRDVSLIITDTEATADLYRKRWDLRVRSVGKFITPVPAGSNAHRDCVTFINPSPGKGASVFIGMVQEARRRGLPARFLVVESRAKLEFTVRALGLAMSEFDDVTRLPLQEDMKTVWSRTRVLLCPSLWHESGSRTILEACSAGIPVLATDSGGSSELLGDAGFLFPIPSEAKEKYLNPIDHETARAWVDVLEKLLTDEEFFRQARTRAGNRWRELNQRDNMTKLEELLNGVLPGNDVPLNLHPVAV